MRAEHSTGLAPTPEPPYVAVIFTSLRTEGDQGYGAMAVAMEGLACQQPGYLGMEAAREAIGITVSYWRDEQAARDWKHVAEHLVAQRRGHDVWYRDYRVRVATVVHEYGPTSSPNSATAMSAPGVGPVANKDPRQLPASSRQIRSRDIGSS